MRQASEATKSLRASKDGAPGFEGRTTTVPEAVCYPRPIQERIPILVGGSGERRTLRLVAERADACNLFGLPDVVRHKVGVLHEHCAAVDRDPSEVEITNLTQVGPHPVEDQIGLYRAYAEAGVQTAIVSLADVAAGGIPRFAPVLEAFS